MKPANLNSVNKSFYDKLYKRRSIFINAIYPYVSFDQQSKSKANFAAIKKSINNRDISVLDFGFGHGSFLLKFPVTASLFGVDISDEAVINFPATARFLGKKVITATPDHLQDIISPKTMDIICMSHVLEHVECDFAELLTMNKYLKDDGRLIVNLPINEVWEDPKHIRSYDLAAAQEMLNKGGFCVIEHFSFDRITAFFLINEQVIKPFILKRILLRAFRFCLSLFPFEFYKWLDKKVFKSYSEQQLILIAGKA
jgi:SAM-dependent methyltransferase